MTDLLVGCPVTPDRDWILPRWFEHVAEAVHQCGTTAALCFVIPLRGSWEFMTSLDIAATRYAGYAIDDVHYLWLDEDPTPARRTWNLERYQHMAELRNHLLGRVRELQPAFFWSLDSDVLAHPRSLVSGLANINAYDALSLRCFLGGENEPNWANIGAGILRYDRPGVFEVDAVMASKLMKPDAYNVDYVAHPWGEDVGWSLACRRAGLRLGHDATYTSAHIMAPDTAPEDSHGNQTSAQAAG